MRRRCPADRCVVSSAHERPRVPREGLGVTGGMGMTTRRNPEMGGVAAGAAMAVAGLAMILLPPLAGIDGMDGGFALQFGGLFLLLCGLVTAAIFGWRAARYQAMVSGLEVLARWTYDRFQVQAQVQRELGERKAHNRRLLLVMAFFIVACTVLFTVVGVVSGEGENMPLFVAIMAGVLAVLTAFALGAPRLTARRALRRGGEAIIATNGLVLNGQLHTWQPPLAGLDGVEWVQDEEGTRLAFHLQTLSGVGWTHHEPYVVEVPVPPGEEDTARQVIDTLSGL